MRGVPGVSTPGKVGRNMDDKHRPEGVEQIRPISLGKTRGWESLMVVEDRTAHVRPLGDVIDFAKERARLEKELKKAEEEIGRIDAKLSNEQFVSRAPEDVLAEQREKRAEYAATAARLKEAVARLA